MSNGFSSAPVEVPLALAGRQAALAYAPGNLQGTINWRYADDERTDAASAAPWTALAA
jgi:hypothetical protein